VVAVERDGTAPNAKLGVGKASAGAVEVEAGNESPLAGTLVDVTAAGVAPPPRLNAGGAAIEVAGAAGFLPKANVEDEELDDVNAVAPVPAAFAASSFPLLLKLKLFEKEDGAVAFGSAVNENAG
jgi:hypothetical protein